MKKKSPKTKTSIVVRIIVPVTLCVLLIPLVNNVFLTEGSVDQNKSFGFFDKIYAMVMPRTVVENATQNSDHVLINTEETSSTTVEETTVKVTTETVPETSADAPVEPQTEPTENRTTTTKAATTKVATTKAATTQATTTNPTASNVVITPLKFGVNQVETTERKYDAENGGYRNYIYVTFDRSGYSATTKDLLADATKNYNKYQSEIQTILQKVNQYRDDAGVPQVTLDKDLSIAAMVRAYEMSLSGLLSHTRPNGSKYLTIFSECGISWSSCGENVAMGYETASKVSQVWKDSSIHYPVMVNSKYAKIGIGVAVDERGCYYWSQEFTN